jgi:hypothetical protein
VCVGAPNTCPDPFTGARGICKQPDGNPDHCFLGIDCMPPDECIGDVCYVSTDPVPTRPPIDYVPTTCPAGQDLSCGTATEAETQNKKTCLYRITCNKYYWPSIIGFPAPCNQNNPVSATCFSNCSCCPTGRTRSCTLGGYYTKDITLPVCAQGDSVCNTQNSVFKTRCDTLDDILRDRGALDNPVLLRDYYNTFDDHLQDWRLFCRIQTCACIAPTNTRTTKFFAPPRQTP